MKNIKEYKKTCWFENPVQSFEEWETYILTEQMLLLNGASELGGSYYFYLPKGMIVITEIKGK